MSVASIAQTPSWKHAVVPAGHAEHWPDTQSWPTRHWFWQLPQALGSFARLAQIPCCSQATVPAGQAVQAPETHICPTRQLFPH